MSDDYEFISNVKALAANGTLAELLSRIEEDAILQWKSCNTNLMREEHWHSVKAIQTLKAKIESLSNEDKIRDWKNQRIARRI